MRRSNLPSRPNALCTTNSGRKAGVLSNPTGVLSNLDHIVDSMILAGARPAAAFGPEHGFRGSAQAGGSEGDYTDPRTGIPVYDAYGASAEDLSAMFVKASVKMPHGWTAFDALPITQTGDQVDFPISTVERFIDSPMLIGLNAKQYQIAPHEFADVVADDPDGIDLRRRDPLGAHLDSEHSLTETRVLYELANRDGVTAADIARELDLDRGYLSRTLRAFRRRGLITAAPSGGDRRRSALETLCRRQRRRRPNRAAQARPRG